MLSGAVEWGVCERRGERQLHARRGDWSGVCESAVVSAGEGTGGYNTCAARVGD